ncbi:hypothetical protein Acor_04370 [Acrocarpospora corrugata]|uniref:Uncharacterized protein n=1 Tax=Acrocarpospora corrugata TaxID=35763 RepID=A0A5M3VNZ1_9ACTN|nr:hypothetical protein Acor_04370 [Acrocarpospora corrugata]
MRETRGKQGGAVMKGTHLDGWGASRVPLRPGGRGLVREVQAGVGGRPFHGGRKARETVISAASLLRLSR